MTTRIYGERRREWLWQAGLLLLLSLYLLYPLSQKIELGYFFYTNGPDEPTYLSYQASQRMQGPTRLSGYLVTGLHELGLRGGTINFLFDSGFLLIAGLLLPRIAKRFFPTAEPMDVYFAALVVFLAPLLLTPLNPAMRFLRHVVDSKHALRYFFVYPFGNDPTYLRTPEEQVSLAVLVVAVWVSARLKSPRWVVVVVPFMYFFCGMLVAATWLIYYGSLSLRERVPAMSGGAALVSASAATLVLLGAGQLVLFRLFDPGRLLLESHVPVFGICLGLLILLCAAAVAAKQRIGLAGPPLAFVASVCAAAVVVYNCNIVSGLVAQPHHYEFALTLAIGLVAAIVALSSSHAMSRRARARTYVLCAAVLLVFYGRYLRAHWWKDHVWALDFEVLRTVPGFQKDIATDPAHVAIDSIFLSYRISGLYLVRGTSLATGLDNVFLADDETYGRFLDLETCVAEGPPLVRSRMAPILSQLDGAFEHRYEDFLALYRARRRGRRHLYESVPRDRAPDCSEFKIYIRPRSYVRRPEILTTWRQRY